MTDEQPVAPAWNDFPAVDSDMKALYGAEQSAFRHQPNTTKPVTDFDSKTVMLQAGRDDTISITAVVERYRDEIEIPDMATVTKRQATYFGPELGLRAEHDGTVYNYLLTAPGPDAHLLLWGATTDVDEDGLEWRQGWYPGAEVQTYLHEVGDKQSLCRVCHQPMETIQHERESIFGLCQRESDLDHD